MKKISMFLLSFIMMIVLSSNVYADSYKNEIYTNARGTKYEYISGLPIYYNSSNSVDLYVLNYGTYYNRNTVLSNPERVDNGFNYIFTNGTSTRNSQKDYYITQVAMLWYQDYLNGNDYNISYDMKRFIENDRTQVSSAINNLVINAKKNRDNYDNSYINFLTKEVKFSRNGNYYVSNSISVETRNLSSNPRVYLSNAPKNTIITNNTVSRNNNGSFLIKIPVSSYNNATDFEVNISSFRQRRVLYKYSGYGVGDSIYGKSYIDTDSSDVVSLPISMSGINTNDVKISVYDKYGNYLSGLNYYIYYGDCSNSVCLSDNLVSTFTTRNTYTFLNNLLSGGKYTLVLKNGDNYNLPIKKLINVSNSLNNNIVIREDNDYSHDDREDVTRKVKIFNNFNDSTEIIKIYSSTGILVNSYRSNETDFEITLNEGTYYITDTKNKFEKIYFKIDNAGKLYVKYQDDYVLCSYIDLSSDKEDLVIGKDNIKYDEDNNTYYVDGLDDITSIDLYNDVETDTDVVIEWLSEVIDCPITSLDKTIKYVVGAIIVALGTFIFVRNVKKTKNNN